MSTDIPIISAAMAVPTFKGTAILLFVTHLSLSTPLMTTPHPLLPFFFCPEVFYRRPCFSITASVNSNFPLSLCPQVGPVISFLIVFPEKVFHVIANLRSGIGDFLFPHDYTVF